MRNFTVSPHPSIIISEANCIKTTFHNAIRVGVLCKPKRVYRWQSVREAIFLSLILFHFSSNLNSIYGLTRAQLRKLAELQQHETGADKQCNMFRRFGEWIKFYAATATFHSSPIVHFYCIFSLLLLRHENENIAFCLPNDDDCQ